jgi:hypothetical protein
MAAQDTVEARIQQGLGRIQRLLEGALDGEGRRA